jgi:transposase
VREFANGKALGSYAGLTATPYSSGGIEREQGIGKAGNARLRTVMVELAWIWQRYQPDSVPPDVRFCRETCVDGSSALVDRLNRAAVT